MRGKEKGKIKYETQLMCWTKSIMRIQIYTYMVPASSIQLECNRINLYHWSNKSTSYANNNAKLFRIREFHRNVL